MNKTIKKIMALTTCATVGIYYFNRVINYTATLKNLLKDNHGDYYKWKNGNVFFTVQGNGSPLLLVHDLYPASSSAEWSKITKKLEKNHMVYCLDLPGCGRSDKPAITYTNYYFVQLLNDFAGDIIGKKTSLIATGTSGSFAIMADAMNKENFEKVIVINPEQLQSLPSKPNKSKQILKHLLDFPIFGTFIYNIKMHEKNIAKIFRENYYYKSSVVSTKTEDIYYESAHIGCGTGRHLLSSICSDYTKINVSHVLPELDHLYLIQSRELPQSMQIVDSYTHQNPKIETAYISNSKFLPQLEIPEKLHDILNMFLEIEPTVYED